MEINHPAHSAFDRAIIREYAERFHLFVIGGSDFHGKYELDSLEIGNFCSIVAFVRINSGNYPTDTWVAQHHFTYRRSLFGFGEDDAKLFAVCREKRVVIGHDVWLGHHVMVMPGVKIENGAVVGSNAVVTHDVESYSIAGRVPAKKSKCV